MAVAGFLCAVGLAFFLAGLSIGRGRLFVPDGAPLRWGLWGMAWFAMFMSTAVFIGRANTIGGVALDTTSIIQLAWVGLASVLALVSLLRAQPWFGLSAAPIWLFVLYGFLGMATSMFSPRPLFSMYKAGVVVFDVLLAAGLLVLALRSGRRHVSDLTLGLVVLAIGGALLGALIWPAYAFQPKPGAFGIMLYGVLPILHPNELGMWAGIVLVVSMARWYVAPDARQKWSWLFIGCASAVVVLLAQSRTSVVAILVSVALAIPYLSKTRAHAVIGSSVLLMIAAGGVGILVVFLGPDVLFSPVINYLERGQAEGGLATMHDRIGAWMNIGWPMFLESPIVGHGFDAGVRFGTDLGIGHLHNSYFQILANSGLLGILPWIAAVVIGGLGLVRHAWRQRSSPPLERARALVPVLILLGLLARSWTGSVMVSHAWSTMMFLALMVDLYAFRARPVASPTVSHPEPRRYVARKSLSASQQA